MAILKKIASFVLLLGCSCGVLCAQNRSASEANAQVETLISAGEYDRLEELLPAVRDSLAPPLCALADALTAYHGGRPAESNAAIGFLFDEYPEVFDLNIRLALLNFSIYNSRTLNDYAGASRTIGQILELLPTDATEARQSLTTFDRWMRAFAAWPVTTVRRPDAETVVPVTWQRTGRGEHLLLDVTMNGRTEPFIFDTGCSGSNFITQAAAERLGVRILADSIPVSGMATVAAKVGVADSLRIGDMVVLHPTFIVVDKMSAEKVEGLCETVLGTDIIRALGEVRIEAHRNRMVLPAAPVTTPPARNLSFDSGLYYLTGRYGDEEQIWQFDTGNVKSTLSQRFHRMHRRELRRTTQKSTSTQGGLGGVVTQEVYVVPTYTLDIAGHELTLHDVTVNIGEKGLAIEKDFEHGSIGVDFLRACDAVVIDLDRMFVRIE